jgi:GNAT superfamily N-acetyltransferase
VFANDPEFRSLLGIPLESAQETLQSERDWFAIRIKAGDILLAIEVDGEYVGDMDVFFARDSFSAEFTLMIYEPRFRGGGIGTEVVQRVLRWLFTGEPLSLGASGQGLTPVHAPFAVMYVDVDTEPGRNPLAYRFWLKQGFRFHHLEENLHWLRLTREDWLTLAGRAVGG